MQPITAAVGTGQSNAGTDAALVQAMLVLTQRAARPGVAAGPYLASYDGAWGPASTAALRAFQADKVFVGIDGKPVASVATATADVVKPGDASWLKLVANLPAAFADLRALPGGKVVYVAASAAQLQAKIAAATATTFTLAFRTKVLACINRMHALHGIAPGVCRDGGRRDFQTQYVLKTSGRNVTNAGPGESNHNFGMAVDLGFESLRWLRADGTVVTNEDAWLHQLDPKQRVTGEALLFWNALRAVGISNAVGMFVGPVGDHPHLQNWSDVGVVMAVRLADLLTRSGSMRWTGARGAYSCDLGLGGAPVAVGRAEQVWNNAATLTLPVLAQARAAAAANTPRAPGTSAPAPAPTPATLADVVAMQRALREQFERADANWQAWTPH